MLVWYRLEWWYFCSTRLETLRLSTAAVRVLCMLASCIRDLNASDYYSTLASDSHTTNWWRSTSTRRRVTRRGACYWTKWLPLGDIPSHCAIVVVSFWGNIWQLSPDTHWYTASVSYRCQNRYDAICYWIGSKQVIYDIMMCVCRISIKITYLLTYHKSMKPWRDYCFETIYRIFHYIYASIKPCTDYINYTCIITYFVVFSQVTNICIIMQPGRVTHCLLSVCPSVSCALVSQEQIQMWTSRSIF